MSEPYRSCETVSQETEPHTKMVYILNEFELFARIANIFKNCRIDGELTGADKSYQQIHAIKLSFLCHSRDDKYRRISEKMQKALTLM